MEVKACVFTDAGKVRRINQDSAMIKVAGTKKYGRISFAVICDGMGGLSRGEVASCKAIRALEKWFCEELPLMMDLEEDRLWRTIETSLSRLFVKTGADIKRYGKHRGIKLGTTVTAFLQIKNRYMTVNIGDSRIYTIDRKKARAVTRDQSVVQDKIDKKLITREEAARDPERNILTQSLGTVAELEPCFSMGEIGSDTTILAVSDGFWRTVSETEMHDKLCPQMCVSPEEMLSGCKKLADLAVSRKEKDNISVAALCLEY